MKLLQVAAAAAYSMAEVEEEVRQSVPSPHGPTRPIESFSAVGDVFERVLCFPI